MESERSRGESRGERLLAFCLFLLLSSVYLLSYSGTFHSGDEIAMFATAQNVVQRGRFDIEPLRGMGLLNGIFGPDGLLYAKYGLGVPLVIVPLVWLAGRFDFLGNVQTAMLLGIPLTALTAVFLFLCVRRLGYSIAVALVTALAFGLGTTSWVYAKYLFSEPLTALCLLMAFYFLSGYRKSSDDFNRPGYALWAGCAVGYAITTRLVDGVIAAPALFLYGFYRPLWGREERGEGLWKALGEKGYRRAAFLFCAPVGLAVGGYVLYSYLRFGTLTPGGQPMHFLGIPLTRGLYGLLLSPGRGLFVYAPLLLLAIPGGLFFWQRHRAEAHCIFGLVAVYLLLYGTWTTWFGGDCWGPRHILPLTPFLALLLAPVIERKGGNDLSRYHPPEGWRVVFIILMIVSVLVQVGGLAVPFGLYLDTLRAQGFRTDAYEARLFFDPRYAPLWGHWTLLAPQNLDFAWMRMAQPDGPISPDWPVLGAQLALVLLSAVFLIGSWKLEVGGRWQSIYLPISNLQMVAGFVLFVVLLGGVSLFTLGRAYYDARDGRKDYRLIAARIHALSKAGDGVVFHAPLHTATLLEYYKSSVPLHGIRDDFEMARRWVADLVADILPTYGRVWWIADGQDFPRGEAEAWLVENGYQAHEELIGHTRLALYALSPSPDIQKVEIHLGEAILLEGYGFDAEIRAGDVLRLELHWRALAPPAEDDHLFVHLLDGEGRLWAQRDSVPLLGLRPTTTWRAGEALVDRYGLLLPAAMPPGPYRLQAGLYRLDDGQRLTTAEGQDHVVLGEVRVSPPHRPPTAEALNVEHRLETNLGGGLELLGCNLSSGLLQPGDTVSLALFWRALAAPQEDHEAFLMWQAEDGRPLEGSNDLSRYYHTIGGPYPTSRWSKGQVVEDRWDVIVPAALEEGSYRLAVRVGSGDKTATLGRVTVGGRERSYEMPDVQHPLEVRLGPVRLLGYDLRSTRIVPGETVHLTLYWQALASTSESYTVFTHLLDGEGHIRGQKDSLPGGGRLPTSSWATGEIIRDEYAIPVGPEAPPGDYFIAVGLYRADTGERLPAFGPQGRLPQDRIVLGENLLER